MSDEAKTALYLLLLACLVIGAAYAGVRLGLCMRMRARRLYRRKILETTLRLTFLSLTTKDEATFMSDAMELIKESELPPDLVLRRTQSAVEILRKLAQK